MAKELEKTVHRLIEESADASARGEWGKALEKGKEAGKEERRLCKHRESNGLGDQVRASRGSRGRKGGGGGETNSSSAVFN
jgi:hypothetical protein